MFHIELCFYYIVAEPLQLTLLKMNSELLATCNALGYLEDEKYFKEPECLGKYKYRKYNCICVLFAFDLCKFYV